MPINIPALAGRLSGDQDGDAERVQATFVPPHLIEQQKVRPPGGACMVACHP